MSVRQTSLAEFSIPVFVDPRPANRVLDQVENRSRFVSDQAISTARNVMNTIRIVGQATGFAMAESLTLLSQSVIIFAQTLTQIAAAEVTTPLTFIQGIMGFTTAGQLFILAVVIDKLNAEQQQRMRFVIALADSWRIG